MTTKSASHALSLCKMNFITHSYIHTSIMHFNHHYNPSMFTFDVKLLKCLLGLIGESAFTPKLQPKLGYPMPQLTEIRNRPRSPYIMLRDFELSNLEPKTPSRGRYISVLPKILLLLNCREDVIELDHQIFL